MLHVAVGEFLSVTRNLAAYMCACKNCNFFPRSSKLTELGFLGVTPNLAAYMCPCKNYNFSPRRNKWTELGFLSVTPNLAAYMCACKNCNFSPRSSKWTDLGFLGGKTRHHGQDVVHGSSSPTRLHACALVMLAHFSAMLKRQTAIIDSSNTKEKHV